MMNYNCGGSGRGRTIPTAQYKQEILELEQKIKTLEDKIDKLQELIAQYEWAMGI